MSHDIPKSLEKQVTLLLQANAAYAVGTPMMTDAEYDKLWQAIKKNDPSNENLYHTGALQRRDGQYKHTLPCYSLDKAMDEDSLLPFLIRFSSDTLIAQPKYDGVSTRIYPTNNPALPFRIVLSGDGNYGDDVTHLADQTHLRYKYINLITNYPYLSCEAIICNSDWDSSLGSNPRNTVAGMLNPTRLEIHPQHSKITFQLHDEHSHVIPPNPTTGKHTLSEVWNKCLSLYHLWSETYPIDGIVIKVQDQYKRALVGFTDHYPLWAIAWKPPIQTEETKVTSIEWNVSRQGKIIPTVIYEPVQIAGTINTRVTANNATWLTEMGIGPNAILTIGKAGEIIPRILNAKSTKPAEVPQRCPACNDPLEWQHKHLICTNTTTCIARISAKLDFAYSRSGIFISDLGPSTIDNMLANDKLYRLFLSKPWALLHPTFYGMSAELEAAIGTNKLNKITHNLSQTITNYNHAHLFAAFFSEGFGYKTALAFLQALNGYSVKRPNESQLNAMIIAYADFKKMLIDLHNIPFAPLPAIPDIRIVITGTLPSSREEIIQVCGPLGIEVQPAITKATQYLIIGDSPGQTKLSAAKRFNIPTQDYDFLLNIINKQRSKGNET